LNCGTCGHSCLGGDCASGICQPFLLGSISSDTDYARATLLDGGKVYVFTQVGRGTAQNAWQFDAQSPSTPVEYQTGNGTVSCVMNGQLFWVNYGAAETIESCTFSNCAATATPVVTLASTDDFEVYPGCDPVNNEIIWVTESGGTSNFTLHRASANGSNARAITQFNFPSDGTSWSFVGSGLTSDQTDRLFFADGSSDGMGSSTLYYISTKTLNAAPVSIVTVTGQINESSFQGTLTNGSLVLSDLFLPTSSTYQVLNIPLPNGVISGSPPVFAAGNIFGGVLDQTNFYGTISSSSTIPSDALIRCPLANCSSPTIIARGQSSANYFAADTTAVYYTTSGTTAALWKVAK
jgi:hypothetical protein